MARPVRALTFVRLFSRQGFSVWNASQCISLAEEAQRHRRQHAGKQGLL